MTKIRRIVARVILPFLTVWLCWLPSTSYAFAPAAVGLYGVSTAAESAAAVAAAGGLGANLGGAALVASGAFAFGASMLAVGATMGYLIVDNLTGELVRIPLTVANPVPAPVAPPSAPLQAGTEYKIDTTSQAVSWQPSYCAAMAQYSLLGDSTLNFSLESCNDAINQAVIKFTPTAYGATCCYGPNPWNATVNGGTVSRSFNNCPSGYLANASDCLLVEARQAVSDHTRDYSRPTPTTLEPITLDVDNAGTVLTQTAAGSYVLAGLEISGKPTKIEITPLESGGSIVSYSTQTTSGMFTTVENVQAKIAPDGKIVSVSGTQAQGNIELDTGTPQTGATVNTGAAIAPSQPVTVSFPNDYAKQGEAETAAQGVKTKLDTIHNDLSAQTQVADPLVPVAGDMPTWGDTFDGLLGWNIPAHAGVCPTPSVDLSTIGLGTHQLTSHCGLLNDNSAPIHGAMVAVFTILALFVVLRA